MRVSGQQKIGLTLEFKVWRQMLLLSAGFDCLLQSELKGRCLGTQSVQLPGEERARRLSLSATAIAQKRMRSERWMRLSTRHRYRYLKAKVVSLDGERTHGLASAIRRTPPPNRCRAMTQSTRQRRESAPSGSPFGHVGGDVVGRSLDGGSSMFRHRCAPPVVVFL
jgi:hypothetical protein